MQRKNEETQAGKLSLEAHLWKWLSGEAADKSLKNAQQIIALTLRKIKPEKQVIPAE